MAWCKQTNSLVERRSLRKNNRRLLGRLCSLTDGGADGLVFFFAFPHFQSSFRFGRHLSILCVCVSVDWLLSCNKLNRSTQSNQLDDWSNKMEEQIPVFDMQSLQFRSAEKRALQHMKNDDATVESSGAHGPAVLSPSKKARKESTTEPTTEPAAMKKRNCPQLFDQTNSEARKRMKMIAAFGPAESTSANRPQLAIRPSTSSCNDQTSLSADDHSEFTRLVLRPFVPTTRLVTSCPNVKMVWGSDSRSLAFISPWGSDPSSVILDPVQVPGSLAFLVKRAPENFNPFGNKFSFKKWLRVIPVNRQVDDFVEFYWLFFYLFALHCKADWKLQTEQLHTQNCVYREFQDKLITLF